MRYKIIASAVFGLVIFIITMAFPVLAAPKNERIAFSSNRDGNYEIYVVKNDGSHAVRLTNNPAEDSHPAWSPDGKNMAFVSERDGNPEIYVMKANGKQQVRLTNNSSDDDNPAWSPDGTRIVFDSDRGGQREIYIMSVDGNNVTELTDGVYPSSDPAWSPDGSEIIYISAADDLYHSPALYQMNADGSNQHFVYGAADMVFNPAYSPDGSKIAVIVGDPVQAVVRILPEGISIPNPLSIEDARFPCWSPDGSQIVFERTGEIFVWDYQSGEQINLTNNSVQDVQPSWSR